MPKVPRKLNALRVEDSPIRSLPEDLCVKDLGRIGRWAEFVLGLAENTLKATTIRGDEDILDHPDFITIDHRFEEDASVRVKDTIALHGVDWSHKLKQPNTGILIGATLHARYANSDVPTVALPHSGVPGDFAEDLSTVLLLAQMQAQAIDWDPDRMVAQACDTAQRIPRLAQDAIRGSSDNDLRTGIESYRSLLLHRLGVLQRELSSPCIEGPRLMIDAVELTHLLAELDNAVSEEDLNERLNYVGLVFWSRDGREDCLDLRSLFLDFSRYDATTSRHVLPLECAKNEGSVRRYLQRIYDAAATDFVKAAEFVLANSSTGTAPQRPDGRPPHSWKLLALVFATAEAWMARAREIDLLNDELESPWNPWDDEPSTDRGLPSLRSYLSELHALVWAMPKITSKKGPWLLSNGQEAIIAVHRQQRASSRASRPALDRLLEESRSEECHDAYDSLLGKLVSLGAIEQSGKPGQLAYRAVRKALSGPWPRRGPITLTQKDVARFLGYRDIREVTNELRRPAEYGGYTRDSADFVNKLLCGHVPKYLAVAAHRYLMKYRSERDQYTGEVYIPDCPGWADGP